MANVKMTRERRTAWAELQVTKARLETILRALRQETPEQTSNEELCRMLASVGESVDRAMGELS